MLSSGTLRFWTATSHTQVQSLIEADQSFESAQLLIIPTVSADWRAWLGRSDNRRIELIDDTFFLNERFSRFYVVDIRESDFDVIADIRKLSSLVEVLGFDIHYYVVSASPRLGLVTAARASGYRYQGDAAENHP